MEKVAVILLFIVWDKRRNRGYVFYMLGQRKSLLLLHQFPEYETFSFLTLLSYTHQALLFHFNLGQQVLDHDWPYSIPIHPKSLHINVL